MHTDERRMISEQLSELFDIAHELTRRLNELAEMVAHPATTPAPVLQLTPRPSVTNEYDRVIAELREIGHIPPASSKDSQCNET